MDLSDNSPPKRYPGIEAVVDRCAEQGGVTIADLEELRDAVGYDRLGKWVLGVIGDALDAHGLGYLPVGALDHAANSEPRKWHHIIVYRKDGGLVDRVVTTVLSPADACQDQVRISRDATLLATLYAGADPISPLTDTQKLNRIRAILG